MPILTEHKEPPRRRLPEWLKVSLPGGEGYTRLKALVKKFSLHTVCESASCPNIGHCWEAGTLTVMILGGTCTRACRFCDVPTGNMLPPNPEEPKQVAGMLSHLSLKHAVITSVDRDDLPDGGSAIWAETIRQTKDLCPGMKIEALIPDFKGDIQCIGTVCRSSPDILAHNLETVESLQSMARPQCRYRWSLDTLEFAAKKFGLITKSSIMLGLGEKMDEVIAAMQDLAGVGCKILSLGQYLRPSRNHFEVVEYIHPETFAEYKVIGESLGFLHVESGPLVRSSYHADQQARGILPQKF